MGFTSKQVVKWNWKHGDAVRGEMTREYVAFTAAKQRCTDPAHKSFKEYSGRGIQFRFKSFQQFLKHLGRKPSPIYVLDRINNDGHYEPGNVRWATPSESMKNRRWTKKRKQALATARKKLTRKMLQKLGQETTARLKRDAHGRLISDNHPTKRNLSSRRQPRSPSAALRCADPCARTD